MTRLIPHPKKQSLFVLLSLADLGLTWWLLGHSGGSVGEGNPLARWLLSNHGWLGLACFKAAVVLLVVLLSAVVSRSRPRAAGRVLGLGCAVLALVVLYSASLCRAACSAEGAAADSARQARELDDRAVKIEAFEVLLAQLGGDLANGRRSLAEAAERAAESERGRDPAFRLALAAYDPDRPTREHFAACLLVQAVAAQPDRPAAWPLALRLEREFTSTYGSPPPLRHRNYLPGPMPEPAAGL